MWRGPCRLQARWAPLLACLLFASTARAQDITWTDNGNGTHVIDDSLGFNAIEYSFVSKLTRGESVNANAFDRFGATVSIDGDTLAVGRPHNDDSSSREYAGEVWMYARDTPGDRTSSWSLVQIVRAPDGVAGDFFAGSLDLDGDTLAVGAKWNEPHGTVTNAGSVYVFTRSVAGVPSSLWTFRQKLQSPTREEEDNFGFAVAVDGDVVVVMGAGPIGCLHVRLARSRGAAKVYLTDINIDRLKLSADRVEPDAAIEGSGADVIDRVMELTDGRGASVIITAAPSGKAQEDAIDMAAPQGRVSFFGGLPKDDPFIRCNSNTVHYRELSLIGANGSSPDHNRRALGLIASGAVPVDDLITHRVPLERVQDAIDAVLSGEAIKVVVEP